MMTKEEIQMEVAAYEAHLRGEEVEERPDFPGASIGNWKTLKSNDMWGPPGNYWRHRLKPKPKVVPWTQEDVPDNCWIRDKEEYESRGEWLVVGVCAKGVFLNGNLNRFDDIAAVREYSTTPRDKTSWRPCTKEVVE